MSTISDLFAIRDEMMAKAFIKRIVKGFQTYKDTVCWIPKDSIQELLPAGATYEDNINGEYAKVTRDRCERILFLQWKMRARKRAVIEGIAEGVAYIAKELECSKQEARLLLQYQASQNIYEQA